MDTLLPAGSHWGLHIHHNPLEDAGDFAGGGRKLVWHTTEGTSLQGAYDTLKVKRAAPHIIIDISSGEVIQTIALDRAARALQHVEQPETNRANCWQIEVVGRTADAPRWSTAEYRRLASLAVLLEHRTRVPRTAPHSFTHPEKFTPEGFVRASGHVGHVHVPGNDHVDITGFRIHFLFDLMEKSHG